MIARSYQPHALNISIGSANARDAVQPDCFAASSEHGDVVVLRCVNENDQAIEATVALVGAIATTDSTGWTLSVKTMHGPSPKLNNTPAQPKLVAPVDVPVSSLSYSDHLAMPLRLLPWSFTVATFRADGQAQGDVDTR